MDRENIASGNNLDKLDKDSSHANKQLIIRHSEVDLIVIRNDKVGSLCKFSIEMRY